MKMQSKVEWDRGSGRTRCVRYFIYLIQTFNYFTSRTCDEEGSPLLESLISTRDDKYRRDGKGYTPFSSCLYLNRRDKKGLPRPCRVSIRIDANRVTRRGKPCLVTFIYTQTRREGVSLPSSCFHPHRLHTDASCATRRGLPPSRRVYVHTDTTRRGFSPRHVFIHRDATRRENPVSLHLYTYYTQT
jgi:hypothetical protein